MARRKRKSRVSRASRFAAFRAPTGEVVRYQRMLRAHFTNRVIRDVLELFNADVLATIALREDAVIAGKVAVAFEQLELRMAELFKANGRIYRSATQVAQAVDKVSKRQFQRLLVNASVKPDAAAQSIFIEDNIRLIRSLTGDQISIVRDVITDAGVSGRSASDITKDLQERLGITRSRANLIARDQVLKLHSNLTKTRQTTAGIRQYVWTTSSDERVRPYHFDLNGTTQAWDNPPITAEDGSQNHPGEDYQCRCIAFPVIDAIEGLNLNL